MVGRAGTVKGGGGVRVGGELERRLQSMYQIKSLFPKLLSKQM